MTKVKGILDQMKDEIGKECAGKFTFKCKEEGCNHLILCKQVQKIEHELFPIEEKVKKEKLEKRNKTSVEKGVLYLSDDTCERIQEEVLRGKTLHEATYDELDRQGIKRKDIADVLVNKNYMELSVKIVWILG